MRRVEFSYIDNSSFDSSVSESASRHHSGNASPSPAFDSDDEGNADVAALLQPRHASESFEETLPEIDVEPFLPDVVTDSVVERIAILPPQSVVNLVSRLTRSLAWQFSSLPSPSLHLPAAVPRRSVVSITPPATALEVPSDIAQRNSNSRGAASDSLVPFEIADPMKLIFDDWHFSFLPVHQRFDELGSKARQPSKPPAPKQIFASSKKIGESPKLEPDHAPLDALPAISPPRKLSVQMQASSSELPPSGGSAAGTPPAHIPPHPLSVLVAVEPHLVQKTPRTLTLEGLPLGQHPRSMCHLWFSTLSTFPKYSLRKLQLPFCGITSRTLLLMVAGLTHASSVSQHLLSEVDLSYNLLSPSSIPILTLLLTTTKVYSMALHGNRIGSAIVDDGNSADVEEYAVTPPPSIQARAVGSSVVSRQGDHTSPHPPPRNTSSGPSSKRRKSNRRSAKMSSTARAEDSEPKRAPIAQFIMFVKDGCAKLESLDISFTHLDPAEQEAMITSIVKMNQLKTIVLDGLKLTPNNAAKLAVAVVDSPSLWNVSVNYIVNCASPQYREKLKLACDERKGHAHLPKLRRNVTFTHHNSGRFSVSTSDVPNVKALMADRAFLDIDNSEWVDDWSISEGYGKYTTNDPSLSKRAKPQPSTAR